MLPNATRVFTDGCCLGNHGRPHARRAGCGVYVGEGDALSLPIDRALLRDFELEHPTNQVAELMAVLAALELIAARAHQTRRWTVLSDSTYAINVCTKWMTAWKRRGWRLGSPPFGPVKNVRVVQAIDRALQIVRQRAEVEFVHVKAHRRPPRGDTAYRTWYGNDRADFLARTAAQRLTGP